MLKILKAYDIPPNLLKAIDLLYQDTKATVLTPDGKTDSFDIVAGILQGDTLAPYLFVIALDFVLRKVFDGKEEELGFKLSRRRSRRVSPTMLTDLDFADDLAIITEEICQAQQILDSLEREAASVGLYCNATKTEYQAFNHPIDHQPLCTSDGTTLKAVSNFKYLGSWTESSEKDFLVRKALAWSACHKLRSIWSSQLDEKMKVRLFKSTVESVFLYGSETWTITKAMKKKIDGCYTKMLRMVKGISWQDRITNKELYAELPPISLKIQQRRMRLAGHCLRHPEEEASKLVLWVPTEGKANRGRKKITYVDNLLQDCELLDVHELRNCITDRDGWRERVSSMWRPGGRPK